MKKVVISIIIIIFTSGILYANSVKEDDIQNCQIQISRVYVEGGKGDITLKLKWNESIKDIKSENIAVVFLFKTQLS